MIPFSTLRELNKEFRLCSNPSGQFMQHFTLTLVSLYHICFITLFLYPEDRSELFWAEFSKYLILIFILDCFWEEG